MLHWTCLKHQKQRKPFHLREIWAPWGLPSEVPRSWNSLPDKNLNSRKPEVFFTKCSFLGRLWGRGPLENNLHCVCQRERKEKAAQNRIRKAGRISTSATVGVTHALGHMWHFYLLPDAHAGYQSNYAVPKRDSCITTDSQGNSKGKKAEKWRRKN